MNLYIEDGLLKRRSLDGWLKLELKLLEEAGIKAVRNGDELLLVAECGGKPVQLRVEIPPQYPYLPPKIFYSLNGSSFRNICFVNNWNPFRHTLAFAIMQSIYMLEKRRIR